MTVKEAKEIDMVDYLSKLGFKAEVREPNYWYHSPFRDERTPSFKVNRSKNRWYDFAEGRGGNLVDFGVLYHKCSVKDFLNKLEGPAASFAQHKEQQQKYVDLDEEAGKIKVLRVKSISSLPLIRYYRERRIPDAIAQHYLKEVNYELNGKNYYALGFPNDKGGFELRNQYIKAASVPKGITYFDNGSGELVVFEGFFNFLSYQAMLHRQPQPNRNFLILNSTSFFRKELPKMQQHARVFLYLDNDNTGQKFTQEALALDREKFSDERGLYRHHTDLNHWLKNFGSGHRQQHRPMS